MGGGDRSETGSVMKQEKKFVDQYQCRLYPRVQG